MYLYHQTVYCTHRDAKRVNLAAQNATKPFGGRDSAADPAGGTYGATQIPWLVGKGLAAPPQEPNPSLSALRASPLACDSGASPLGSGWRRPCVRAIHQTQKTI